MAIGNVNMPTEQHHHAAGDLAEHRHGHDIAIPHRGQRGERPPHGRRHGAESIRLYILFKLVHHRRGQKQQAAHDDERARNGVTLAVKDAGKRRERGRIAPELQEPDQPEDPQEAQIQRNKETQPERQNDREVDQHRPGPRKLQPDPP